MKYEVCDHYWDYIKGTKQGVTAKCIKCDLERLFTWYEWKSLAKESKKLGTSRF